MTAASVSEAVRLRPGDAVHPVEGGLLFRSRAAVELLRCGPAVRTLWRAIEPKLAAGLDPMALEPGLAPDVVKAVRLLLTHLSQRGMLLSSTDPASGYARGSETTATGPSTRICATIARCVRQELNPGDASADATIGWPSEETDARAVAERAERHHSAGNGSARVPVTVVGDGDLAALIRAGRSTWPAPDGVAALTVIAGETFDPGEMIERERALWEAGHASLSVRFTGDEVELGPVTVPGRSGCTSCVHERGRRALGAAQPAGRPTGASAAPPLAPHWVRLAAELVLDLLAASPDSLDVCVLAPERFAVSWHRLDPVPDCHLCDTRPDDQAEAARLSFRARPATEPETLRTGAGVPLANLEDVLVQGRFGAVTALTHESPPPLEIYTAAVACPDRRRLAFGRGHSRTEARRLALLEAIERDCAASPGGLRTTVQGSYADLRARAVDPSTLGLPDPAGHGRPGFALDPYDPDAPTAWVWGWSLERSRPVLVPEHVAYHSAGPHSGARFVAETSNGCAVGNCLEEAVLHACLEVAERDAFLTAWYARRPGTRLAWESAADPVASASARYLASHGHRLHLFDITAGNGIPVIWALAVNPDDPHAASLSAAAAHLMPHRAVRAAVAELATMLRLAGRHVSVPAARRRRLLAEPESVISITDHVGAYTVPEALNLLDWQLAGGGPEPGQNLDVQFADWRERWLRADLAETLRLVINAMSDDGMPPIAIRQTTARETRLGVEAVRVVAPGAVPLSVGHLRARTVGLPRLDAARRATGTTDPPLPHPFP